MERLFKIIITRFYSHIIIASLGSSISFALGLTFGLIYDNHIYTFIGVLIAMIISVFFISRRLAKAGMRKRLREDTIKNNIGYMEFKNISSTITEITDVFSILDIGTILDVTDSMSGNLDNISVSSANIKIRLNQGILRPHMLVRVYKLKFKDNIKVKILDIKDEYLSNMRYEIRDNVLYLELINKYSTHKKFTFTEQNFNSYNDYINRYKLEDKLIKKIIKYIGV